MRQLKEKKKKLSKEEKKALKKALKIENENKIGINQFVKVGVFLLFSLAIEITGFALINLKNPLTGSSPLPRPARSITAHWPRCLPSRRESSAP